MKRISLLVMLLTFSGGIYAQTYNITGIRMYDPSRFVAEAWQTQADLLDELSDLFDSQIATLEERGVPGQITEALKVHKNDVVEYAAHMTISEGNIPFLPVIPIGDLGYYGLMDLVRSESEENGLVFLRPYRVIDQFKVPNHPYYIFNVEDGESTLGELPEDAEKIFKQQNRSGLTAAESIALATHTDVLSKHSLWAVGSRYDSGYTTLSLTTARRAVPLLSQSSIVYASPTRGSASCSSRLWWQGY